MAALGLRMRYMQVEEADKYRLLADENRINIRLIPPARGLIFDRNGILLAGNEQNYRVVIVREDAGDVEAVLDQLAAARPADRRGYRPHAEGDQAPQSAFVPITVADRLTWDDLARVAVNAPALPGVTPEVGLSRHYPLDSDLAHVVGYVGPVSEADLQRLDDPDPLLQIPKFQIGKIGVEAKLEDVLRGTRRHQADRGQRRRPGDARARPDRKRAGRQYPADHRRGAAELRPGAARRHERRGGGDRHPDRRPLPRSPRRRRSTPTSSSAASPSVDYNALMENDHRPLANKSVQGVYPPGSTFKIVTALSALHAGRAEARRERSAAPAISRSAGAGSTAGSAAATARSTCSAA